MQRHREVALVRLAALAACLVATLPVARVFAQSRLPGTTSKAAIVKTKATPDTSTPGVMSRIAVAMQQPVARAFPAPAPCVGNPTVTHGRHGDSVSVPELRKMPVPQARAVLARLHLIIDVRTTRANASQAVVIAQSPPNTPYVALGDTVIVCSPLPVDVDTAVATAPSAPTVSTLPTIPIVRMPSLIDSSYATATRMLSRLLRFGRLNPPVNLTSVNGQKVDPARSIVAGQRPTPGTILTPISPILIIFRDTTTIVASAPPPPRDTTRIVQPPAPTRDTTMVSVAPPQPPRDTTSITRPQQPIGATTAAQPRRPRETTTVASQRQAQPNRGATAVVTRPIAPRDTASVIATPPPRLVARIPLWVWIAVAAGILLAGATLPHLRQRWKDRAQLAALEVVPHLDTGRPRVVFTAYDDETAEEAFARIGLTVRAVADPGTPQLHFPRPQKRSETSNV